MLFVRGHPAMYDRMAADGCSGWSYAECLPYFRKLEDCAFGASGARARGGPVGVERVEPDPISDAFLAGWGEMGYPVVEDYNDPAPDGASYLQLSSRKGLRCSAADGYIKAIGKRPNLTVLTGASVKKVLFDGLKATGIAYTLGGAAVEARRRAKSSFARRRAHAATPRSVGPGKRLPAAEPGHSDDTRQQGDRREPAGPPDGAHLLRSQGRHHGQLHARAPRRAGERSAEVPAVFARACLREPRSSPPPSCAARPACRSPTCAYRSGC